MSIMLPMAVTGAPHKYDQGHILPNLIAEYEGMPVTQKVVNEKEAKWPNGTVKAAEGVFWVRTKREGAKTEALKEDGKLLVVGKVGDADIESRIQNREAAVVNLMAILVAAVVTVVLV